MSLPDDFLSEAGIISELHSTCTKYKLESSLHRQSDIDEAYMSLCTNLKREMPRKLQVKKKRKNLISSSLV